MRAIPRWTRATCRNKGRGLFVGTLCAQHVVLLSVRQLCPPVLAPIRVSHRVWGAQWKTKKEGRTLVHSAGKCGRAGRHQSVPPLRPLSACHAVLLLATSSQPRQENENLFASVLLVTFILGNANFKCKHKNVSFATSLKSLDVYFEAYAYMGISFLSEQ